ncbi:MAG: 30S ribosomal protein S2 [Patescibacteria group bacterium]
MVKETKTKADPRLDAMATAGMHFGAPKSRRHPSTKNFVFGVKNNFEIIDLDKTRTSLEKAKEFVSALGKEGKVLLLVGNKSEARDVIKQAALRAGLPYVALRWMGGTLTNFDEIRKRVDRLGELEAREASGDLGKYTKKERARISHEVKNLKRFFSGITEMQTMPSAMFVIDSDKEEIALTEARRIHIPTISLSSTDCNINDVNYPIVGNDKAVASIKYIVNEIITAYKG